MARPSADKAVNDLGHVTDHNLLAARRAPGVVVASIDAPDGVKDAADYVCDGTNDQVEIQAAINRAAPLQSRNARMPAEAEQRGTVQLSGGRFNVSSPILMRTGVTLAGMGELTEVRAVSITSTTGYPSGVSAVVKQSEVQDHIMCVRDLWINGNYASGGSCNGIVWAGPGGNASEYPSSNPDPSNHIRDVRLTWFTGGSTRHGIWLQNNVRAGHYHNIWVRDVNGYGFFADSTPDSVLTASDFGGCGVGVYIAGANWRVSSTKTYYSGLNGGSGTGFYFGSGRHSVADIEAQDEVIGVNIAAIKSTFTGLNIDCCSTDGLIISGSRNSIMGAIVYQRSGGRFTSQTNGIRFSGTPTDILLTGWIESNSGGIPITNTYVGAPGTRSFVRVADDSSGLRSVG